MEAFGQWVIAGPREPSVIPSSQFSKAKSPARLIVRVLAAAAMSTASLGNHAHLLPPSWTATVTQWLAEDTPSLDYGGFVVGESEEEAVLWGKAAVHIRSALNLLLCPANINTIRVLRASLPACLSSTRYSNRSVAREVQPVMLFSHQS
jgi:hypothetical protein